MRLRDLTVILSFAALLAVISIAPAIADSSQSPELMLTTYYNDISLGQFPAAYGMWVKPPQTYDIFVTGYADTDHVTPYLGDYQAVDNVAGFVPGVLVGYRKDGSIVSYHGCFSVVINTASVFGWTISGATFAPLTNDLPDNDLIMGYLALDCRSSVTTFPTPAPTATIDPLSNINKAYNTLTTYYELINKKDFASAYALWLHPIPGTKPNGAPGADYRTPYNAFVAGYQTTKFVDVYPGVYDETGGSMGHGYLDGEMPVLLIAEHTDGTYVGYIGCYVMGGMQGLDFGIVSGAFNPISTALDIPRLQDNLSTLKTICDDLQGNLKF